MKNKLFSFVIILAMLISLMPASSYAAQRSFYDGFEDYPSFGAELFPLHFDAVAQDVPNGGKVTSETDNGNGFAAFVLKPQIKNSKVTTPNVFLRKNGFDASKEPLVIEARFYTFDENAKMSLIFTDKQQSFEKEVISLKGTELRARNSNNLLDVAQSGLAMRAWNRLSVVYDGKSSSYKLYVNGAQLGGETKIDALDSSDMSVKISVKNNTDVAYSEGRIYMDDFCIYNGNEPVENVADLQIAGVTRTYLNKQFTSIFKMGRAHGISGFDKEVISVPEPSEENRSVCISLGADSAFMPLDSSANEAFSIKAVYKSDANISLMAKSKNGKQQQIAVLPVAGKLSEFTVYVDMQGKKAKGSDGSETSFDLDEISYLGFDGEGSEITLNKLFAVSGSTIPSDDYFKDYCYTQKAIAALVTDEYKRVYNTISQGVFMSVDFYQANVFGSHIRFSGQPPRIIDDVLYVPLEDTAVMLGGEVSISDGKISVNTGTSVFSPSADEILVHKHTNYVTAEYIASKFGLTLSFDGEYLIGFGKTSLFSVKEELDNLKAATYYQRPTGEEIYDRILQNGDIHPRIYADAKRIAEIKYNVDHYPTIKVWYTKQLNDANKYLTADRLFYSKPDGTRLMTISGYLQERMQSLGLAYKLTGDVKYAEAAWRDLEAVSGFSDWNPSHYLDTAIMAKGVAVGYSWFYDYLSDTQKDIIVNGYKRCGLGSYIEGLDFSTWWAVSPSNWNPWCHGGMLCALVAMSDRLGEDAIYALDRMFPYLEYLYPEFVPDGAWAEGMDYHAATLQYIAEWCETLEVATGKDYGYWDLPGMDMTAYYGDALSGKGGMFNYGDATGMKANYSAQAWFAKKYNDPGMAVLRYNNIAENGLGTNYFDLIMTRPELMTGESEMDKDMRYKEMHIATMRTSWEDSSSGFFVAAKGGYNGVSHFHYDLGGFVMDVGGERFAAELGRDSYSVGKEGEGDYLYKRRAEGHNTYVINPSEDPGQGGTAFAPITEFVTKEKGGYAVIDLSNAYTAKSMQRGFMLTDDRRTLIIQDEVSLVEKSDIHWFMHTAADIELADNNKTAYLTNNGVKIKIEILESDNAGAQFEIRETQPFPTTPYVEGQGLNGNFKKLAIHWDGAQDYTLAVAVRQIFDDALDAPYEGKVIPISEWSIPDGEIEPLPELVSIRCDGKVLEGFDPAKTSYVNTLSYDAETKPVYTYEAKEGQEVTVMDYEGVTGVTKYIVRDTKTNYCQVYTIITRINGYMGVIPGTKELPIKSVTASAEPEYDAGNRAVCVLDGDFATRWTATDDAWICLELEEPTEVFAIGMAWNQGSSRQYLYDLEVSEDGTNWTTVMKECASTGTTDGFETYLLGNKKVKYVRYQGHGHSAGGWNNVTEMRLYAR